VELTRSSVGRNSGAYCAVLPRGETVGALRCAHPPYALLIVHDFMVDDDKTGPAAAALWLLTCMFNDSEAVVLTRA
jgi:hypothetical protein